MCACVHYESTCVRVSACMLYTGRPEQDTECLVLSLLPYSSETDFLTDSGARLVARKPNDPSVRSSHSTEEHITEVIGACAAAQPHPTFYMASGNLISDSHACTANAITH